MSQLLSPRAALRMALSALLEPASPSAGTGQLCPGWETWGGAPCHPSRWGFRGLESGSNMILGGNSPARGIPACVSGLLLTWGVEYLLLCPKFCFYVLNPCGEQTLNCVWHG